MYIYIHTYIYIHAHIYIHTHIHTHMHIRAYIQGKHIVVMWYGIIMHLRRQPVKPKHSRLPLYLYPHEEAAWEEADVRPLYNIMQIGNFVAR